MEGVDVAERAPITVGRVLGDTFATFFGHVLQFVAVSAVGFSPALLVRYGRLVHEATAGVPLSSGASRSAFYALAFLDSALFMVLAQVVGGALVYGVFQSVRGREVRIGECLAIGARFLPRLALVGLIVTLLGGLGLIACIVPGFLVLVMFSLAIPVTVVERAGVRAALDRSRALTRGHCWTIAGVIVVVVLLGVVTNLILARLCGGPRSTLFLVLAPLGSMIVGGLEATATAILYHRLRSAREGFDVDEIAAVFE
jgi:hypothetical protein